VKVGYACQNSLIRFAHAIFCDLFCDNGRGSHPTENDSNGRVQISWRYDFHVYMRRE
jgi:hypothetical protein